MTVEIRLRHALRHWGPWMVLAYFALVFVMVYLVTLNARTLRKETVRQAAVARCLASRPQIRSFSRHVTGVNELALILVKNSQALLRETPRSDPEYRVRLMNLRRITLARGKVAAVVRFPTPTVEQCKSRTN